MGDAYSTSLSYDKYAQNFCHKTWKEITTWNTEDEWEYRIALRSPNFQEHGFFDKFPSL
jgi:hypothetical protein